MTQVGNHEGKRQRVGPGRGVTMYIYAVYGSYIGAIQGHLAVSGIMYGLHGGVHT